MTTEQEKQQEHDREQQRAAAARKAFIAEGFDLVAESYDEVNGGFFRANGARLAERAGLRPGDRVLDLGCGRGAVLFAAASLVGPDGYVAGLDLSPGMVHATSAEITRRGLRNVVARVGDAEDPGIPAHSFEAVTAGLMMFLTPDPAAVLRAAHRVLTPGGHFAMSTFGESDPGWTRPLDAALSFLENPPATSSPQQGGRGGNGVLDTVDAIAALLSACGFGGITMVEERTVREIESGEAWWQSQWATGRRIWFERIPPQRLPEAKAAALAEIDALRSPDGALRTATTIRYTVAQAA